MNSTDFDRLTRSLQLAERTYSKNVTEQMVKDWIRLLGDLPFHSVEDAIEQHCAFNKFFPRPADIRKRVTGSENDGPKVERSLHCSAQGCPLPASSFEPSLCYFHGHPPIDDDGHKLPESSITDRIISGGLELAPNNSEKSRVEMLVEMGKYDEVRAMRKPVQYWAREQVKLGNLKRGSWSPGSREFRAVQEFLGRAATEISEAA